MFQKQMFEKCVDQDITYLDIKNAINYNHIWLLFCLRLI